MSSTLSQPDELAKRIADGDTQAEAALVVRFRPGLLSLLRQRSRDRVAAEDLCHETLTAALEGLRAGRLRDPSRLAAYLRGIAENMVRRGRRRSRHERGAFGDAPESVDPEPGPEDRLLADERRARVREALDRLSFRDRSVLGDYFLGEVDKAAICLGLGLAPGHFDLIKHRALKRFARSWNTLAAEATSPPLGDSERRDAAAHPADGRNAGSGLDGTWKSADRVRRMGRRILDREVAPC